MIITGVGLATQPMLHNRKKNFVLNRLIGSVVAKLQTETIFLQRRYSSKG
jgi:hypothetical protein